MLVFCTRFLAITDLFLSSIFAVREPRRHLSGRERNSTSIRRWWRRRVDLLLLSPISPLSFTFVLSSVDTHKASQPIFLSQSHLLSFSLLGSSSLLVSRMPSLFTYFTIHDPNVHTTTHNLFLFLSLSLSHPNHSRTTRQKQHDISNLLSSLLPLSIKRPPTPPTASAPEQAT